MSAVQKSISITKEQDVFLKRHRLNLSRMTQDMITRMMDDIAFAQKTEKNLCEMEQGNFIEMDFDEFLAHARK